LSKLLIYEFHYDYIKKTYGDRAKLLFTDTDSLTYHIETENLYADMQLDRKKFFDTSNFDLSHYLYSEENKKVVGMFKVETGSAAPRQYVGLRAKLYSLLVTKGKGDIEEQVKNAVKGIPKAYVRKYIRHARFLAALKTKKENVDKAKFRCFRSKNHVLKTMQIEKVCLSAWDDRRYIEDDGIGTLAHGHVKIRNGPCRVNSV